MNKETADQYALKRIKVMHKLGIVAKYGLPGSLRDVAQLHEIKVIERDVWQHPVSLSTTVVKHILQYVSDLVFRLRHETLTL